jgi:hypothetical protein
MLRAIGVTGYFYISTFKSLQISVVSCPTYVNVNFFFFFAFVTILAIYILLTLFSVTFFRSLLLIEQELLYSAFCIITPSCCLSEILRWYVLRRLNVQLTVAYLRLGR